LSPLLKSYNAILDSQPWAPVSEFRRSLQSILSSKLSWTTTHRQRLNAACLSANTFKLTPYKCLYVCVYMCIMYKSHEACNIWISIFYGTWLRNPDGWSTTFQSRCPVSWVTWSLRYARNPCIQTPPLYAPWIWSQIKALVKCHFAN